jgi:hypothetical protein
MALAQARSSEVAAADLRGLPSLPPKNLTMEWIDYEPSPAQIAANDNARRIIRSAWDNKLFRARAICAGLHRAEAICANTRDGRRRWAVVDG